MPTLTLTNFRHVSASNGKAQSQYHSGKKYPTWASDGICVCKWCTCWRRKKSSTWRPSRNGGVDGLTISLRHNSSMESWCTWRRSFQPDALTSPAWRLCSPHSTTILSARIPPHKAHQMTCPGGNANSGEQASPLPSPSLNPSLNVQHTQTRAPVSAWRSRWASDGRRGVWPPAGSPKEGTSSGPRPSGLNFSPSAYSLYQAKGITSLSTGTIAQSSRDGGRVVVPTGPPTKFSNASSSSRRIAVERYTQDISPARRTLLTLPPGVTTPLVPSCSALSPSPAKLGPFSSMSDPGELMRKTIINLSVRTRGTNRDPSDDEQRASKQCKVTKARLRHIPIPPATTPTPRGPAPYLQHLTPTPSSLRPHCLARDRLRLWTPALLPIKPVSAAGLNVAERERVKETMLHAWEENTCVAYGAGLLMWHCFCNNKGVPEEDRALAAQALLSTFITYLVAAYSGRMIAGYVNGV